jgi:hypothetical protein
VKRHSGQETSRRSVGPPLANHSSRSSVSLPAPPMRRLCASTLGLACSLSSMVLSISAADGRRACRTADLFDQPSLILLDPIRPGWTGRAGYPTERRSGNLPLTGRSGGHDIELMPRRCRTSVPASKLPSASCAPSRRPVRPSQRGGLAVSQRSRHPATTLHCSFRRTR